MRLRGRARLLPKPSPRELVCAGLFLVVVGVLLLLAGLAVLGSGGALTLPLSGPLIGWGVSSVGYGVIQLLDSRWPSA